MTLANSKYPYIYPNIYIYIHIQEKILRSDNLKSDTLNIHRYVNAKLFSIIEVFLSNMDSALNIDTPNIFKNNKFGQHMALHVREEQQLKRQFSLENAKKRAVRLLKKLVFSWWADRNYRYA